MTDTLLFITLGAVVIIGAMVLDRLPKPSTHSDYRFEPCDFWITCEIEGVSEQPFKIEFSDDWEIGRGFNISGPVLQNNEEDIPDFDWPQRLYVRIGPIHGALPTSRVGWIGRRSETSCELNIGLPTQICDQLLQDLKANPQQRACFGIKRTERNGKSIFGIFSIELEPGLYHDAKLRAA